MMSSIHTFSPCFIRDPRFRLPESRFTATHFAIASFRKPNCCSETLPDRFSFGFTVRKVNSMDRRRMTSAVAAGPMFFPENPIIGDFSAMVFSGCFALSILKNYEETARRGIFDQVCCISLTNFLNNLN